MWSAFNGEGFKPVHVKLCRFPEDWTSFWTDMIHHDPKDEGGEFDESSRLLASFTYGFDHVSDIIYPSVDSTVSGNYDDDLQHFQFEVASPTC